MSGNKQAGNALNTEQKGLYPKQQTPEGAVSLSRLGIYAAIWGAFSALFTAYTYQFFGEEFVLGESFRNQDLVLYVIAAETARAVLFLLCAYFIWQRASLIFAVISFVLIFIEIAARVIELDIGLGLIVWLWALLGAANSIRGVRAIEDYSRQASGAD